MLTFYLQSFCIFKPFKFKICQKNKITITLEGKTTECPVLVGTENEYAINIDKLREDTGL
jgi:hypothetical protein